MRRLAAVLFLTATAAAPDPAVYTCRVPVTGADARNRPLTLEACVRQVLVKLSGNPALAEDPRTASLPNAAAAVRDFAYLDLMTDIPLHDEQGTRDRPFEFLGHVDPAAAEAALDALGIAAWTTTRPTVHIRVAVTDQKGNRFDLTGDGARGERQRRALLDAAELYALPVALAPTEADPAAPPAPLLSGILQWSDADFGWNATWRMSDTEWTVQGVSFDAAFPAGLGRAATLLQPRSRPAPAP